MTIENIENQVKDILKEAAEYWDVKIMLDYSGRGMAGRECLGIISKYEGTSEGKDLADYIERRSRELSRSLENKELTKKLNSLARKLKAKPSVDHFGKGYINYFKRINFS